MPQLARARPQPERLLERLRRGGRSQPVRRGRGTETDGSIVSPASVNGVVGFKPTVGLVSRAGIIPIAHSQDTAGPLARTVEAAVLLVAAVQGPDPRDAATARIPAGALIDPAEVLGPAAVAGYPHVTVPAGLVFGLPWGVSILGTVWADAKVLRLARAVESVTRARRVPLVSTTLEL